MIRVFYTSVGKKDSIEGDMLVQADGSSSTICLILYPVIEGSLMGVVSSGEQFPRLRHQKKQTRSLLRDLLSSTVLAHRISLTPFQARMVDGEGA
jgi:hypothetical protein